MPCVGAIVPRRDRPPRSIRSFPERPAAASRRSRRGTIAPYGRMATMNSQRTIDQLRCPARLSQTRISRSGGNDARGSCPSHVAHRAACGRPVSPSGAAGNVARIAVSCASSHGCRTAFVVLVTPLPRTSPVARAKDRQQFRGTGPQIFVRLPQRIAFRSPAFARIRHHLIRPRLVLATDRNPRRFCPPIRQLDQPLFLGLWIDDRDDPIRAHPLRGTGRTPCSTCVGTNCLLPVTPAGSYSSRPAPSPRAATAAARC